MLEQWVNVILVFNKQSANDILVNCDSMLVSLSSLLPWRNLDLLFCLARFLGLV